MKIYNINYLGVHGGAAADDGNSGEDVKKFLEILKLEEESKIYEFNKFSGEVWYSKLKELDANELYDKFFFRVSKVVNNYTYDKIEEFMKSQLKLAFEQYHSKYKTENEYKYGFITKFIVDNPNIMNYFIENEKKNGFFYLKRRNGDYTINRFLVQMTLETIKLLDFNLGEGNNSQFISKINDLDSLKYETLLYTLTEILEKINELIKKKKKKKTRYKY